MTSMHLWYLKARTNGCRAPIWFEEGLPYCYKCGDRVFTHKRINDTGREATWYEMVDGEVDEYTDMLRIMVR